jgi:fimbrial isopeptide formation D2 family protein/LPXTG-motif cell wall-anchored protein
MQTNRHPAGRRLAAAVGVVALSLSGLIGGAGVASADPNYGNIDQGATGSIIIHKHLNGDGTQGTPDGKGTEGSDTVSDVSFAAYPITSLDLSKSADWDTLSTLQVPDSACANPDNPSLTGQTLGSSAGSATTGSDGVATISGLSVRAYLVCETAAPANIVQKAKPFVVTIPYPNTAEGGDGSWLYNVNVYPKNTEVSIAKTVEDQAQYGYGLGSVVSFPVTTTVPALDDASNFQYFQIKDQMDERFSDLAVSQVTLGETTLAATTDYTVDISGNTVTVKFTSTGLTKLKSAAGQQVKAVFQGKVTSVGDGEIKNTAQLITDTAYGSVPDNPPDNPDPEDPPTTPEVKTNWGDLKVHKVDADNADTGLAGAIFQVYNTTDPYAADCSNATKTGDPISVGGTNEFTSDENGLVNIAGLFVSDSEHSPVNATQRCYVLVETQAPAGFVKQSGDIRVTVKTGTTSGYDVTVENGKQAVPGLPLTGAQGKVLMMIIGAVLILTAATTVAVRSRRATATA